MSTDLLTRLIVASVPEKNLRVRRQPRSEDRAAAGAFSAVASPPCAERDLADDREPEPRAGQVARVRGPVEAVEDVGEVLLGDPRAVVAHGHLGAGHRDVDRVAPLRGVVEQVRDRAVELGAGRRGRPTPRASSGRATFGVRTFARATAPATSSSRRTSSISVGRSRSISTRSPTSVAELLDLADHVGEELLALARRAAPCRRRAPRCSCAGWRAACAARARRRRRAGAAPSRRCRGRRASR